MKSTRLFTKILVGVLLLQVVFIDISCAQKKERGEKEEDGKRYTKTQTYDVVKKGVRLVLKYDKKESAFIGTIENVTKKNVDRARVEVHLSNGVELGPTKPTNLKPGEKIEIILFAKGQKFEKWSTHAEVGSNEHGHGSEGEGREHKHGKEN